MTPRPTSALFQALEAVVLVLALFYLCLYPGLAVTRLAYPYELEWMEGGVVDHVVRVLNGSPLYVEPSLDFTPFIYTPLYYVVSAVPAALFGVGFVPLRLVSILASAGCLAVLYAFVRGRTRSARVALLAPCLFAATYEAGGAWLDLARVDSLSLFFLLSGVLLVRDQRSMPRLALAGLLAALAFLTKQSALPVAALVGVYCLWRLPGRSRFVYPATFFGLVALSTALLDLASGGWYSYYVFRLPSGHRIVTERIAGFWLADMPYVLIALVIALVYLWRLARTRRRDDLVFHACLLVGAVGTSWAARTHAGGWVNVLMPAFAVVALQFSLGVAELMPAGSRWSARSERCAPESASRWRGPVLLAACLAQLLVLAYDPRRHVPDAADRQAGDAFIALLGTVEGEVFVPFHGYLPSLAGKRTHAQGMALEDVFRGADEETKTKLRYEISKAVHERRFDAIALDRDRWGLLDEVRRNYASSRPVFDDGSVFWPVTGLRTRPEILFTKGGRAAPAD